MQFHGDGCCNYDDGGIIQNISIQLYAFNLFIYINLFTWMSTIIITSNCNIYGYTLQWFHGLILIINNMEFNETVV